MTPSTKKTIHKDVSVGIDWADKKHDYHLIAPDGKSHTGIFLHTPEAIAQVVADWQGIVGDAPLCISIEATRGPLINALLALIVKYSTLPHIQKAGETKLRKFFLSRGLTKLAEERIKTLLTAAPLSSDATLLRSCSRRAKQLCEQLQLLNKQIKQLEVELASIILKHPDQANAKSFPEAGVVTRARLIVAMGDDRSRYPSSASLSACSGIAPVTIHSGRMKVVRRRWACPIFMKQTFHEYAGQSIKKTGWAKAFYDLQIIRGKSAHVARRALAFKWQRIMNRCWQSGEPYDEERYVLRLRATGSPVITVLDKILAKAA